MLLNIRRVYLPFFVILGFFSDKEDNDDYAIGSPNANSYRGAVFVCPNCFDEKEVRSFNKPIEIRGTQLGERFGHSLCAVDINGDGYDDIVVGAPLYSSKKEVSKPYIFGKEQYT